MNAELKATLTRLLQDPEYRGAVAADDQKRARLVSLFAGKDSDFLDRFSLLISDKSACASRAKATDDFVVCELAMVGLSFVHESLCQQIELEQEATR